MVHVQRQHAHLCIATIRSALQADLERLSPNHRREVSGVPSGLIKEQIFALLETKQSYRTHHTVGKTLQQDGVPGLNRAKLQRKGNA